MSKKPTEAAKGKYKVTRAVPVGSYIVCADNTGAKILKVVQVVGYKGRLRRRPAACVGDHIKVTVYSGPAKLRKKVLDAVLIRQRYPIRRRNGMRVMFEDNAAVLITPEGELMGTEIRGPVSLEAANLWPKIASASIMVV